MPKRSQEELEEIQNRLQELILEHEEGIARPELQEVYRKRYGENLADRSVRRWLNQMEEEGRIGIEGEGKSRRYTPPDSKHSDQGDSGEGDEGQFQIGEMVEEQAEESIPLSGRGKEIRKQIRKPISDREPVGYNRDFLDGYEPNSTWYLPEATRKELNEVGETPEQNRPAGTYAKKILEPLLIDLSWSSSRLEGNTYNRAETEELILEGKEARGKDPTEAQMILNHKSAIELLVGNIEEFGFNEPTLFTIHASLSENLLGDPDAEGALRQQQVGIGESTYTPTSVPQLIQECFGQILNKAERISDPFEQAFFIMVQLPYLQPFLDVNKRTSRIAANIPLFKQNYSPLSFIQVPRDLYLEAMLAIYELNEYELLRDLFVWAYKRSCKEYKVVKDSVEKPDPIRLKYREELEELVGTFVREMKPPTSEAIREVGSELGVSSDDLDKFTDVTLQLLHNLNRGKAGRYRIRPDELKRWKGKFFDQG